MVDDGECVGQRVDAFDTLREQRERREIFPEVAQSRPDASAQSFVAEQRTQRHV